MCFSIQVDKNIKSLAQRFKAGVAVGEFKQLQNLIQSQPNSILKTPSDDGRVFPNYFAPVIKSDGGNRVIYPMRYRIRPKGSTEEVPTKFNVFNARLDSLDTRKTWKLLFGRNHGVVPLKRFFEWVPGEDKKPKLISFFPEQVDSMWSPCLFDHWQSSDGSMSYFSFAIITTEPPPEILEKGHDRCPIFLKDKNIDSWLNEKNKSDAYELLRDGTNTQYAFEWA